MLPLTEPKPKELHTKKLQRMHTAGSLQSQIKSVLISVISVQEWCHQQITSFFFFFGHLKRLHCRIFGNDTTLYLSQHRYISPPPCHRAPENWRHTQLINSSIIHTVDLIKIATIVIRQLLKLLEESSQTSVVTQRDLSDNNATARPTFTLKAFEFVLLERRTRRRRRKKIPPVFPSLDAKIPAQPSRSIVETRVLSSILAHPQHMAVTIHQVFRNTYGRSFMPL